MFKKILNSSEIEVLDNEALKNINGQASDIIYYCIDAKGNSAYVDTDISGGNINCYPVAEVMPSDKSPVGPMA